MARGRALKTKDATVVILQRGDENFWSFEEESEHVIILLFLYIYSIQYIFFRSNAMVLL